MGYRRNDDSNLPQINLFLKFNCQNEFCLPTRDQSIHACEKFLTFLGMRMAMKYVSKFGFTASFSLCFLLSARQTFKLFLMQGLRDHRVVWVGWDLKDLLVPLLLLWTGLPTTKSCTRSRWPGPHPWPWTPPGLGCPQLLWATCAVPVPHYCQNEKFPPNV